MTKSERQRARRDQRRPDPQPIRLTERDLDVLQAVYDYRVLTTQQIQTLFFPVCAHRLRPTVRALSSRLA